MKKKNFTYYWEQPPEKIDMDIGFDLPVEQSASVNIEETEKEIIIKADLGDFEKDDIEIILTESLIDIAASRNHEKHESLVREKYSSSMRESFNLPSKIDPDSAIATMEGTLLVIRMRKSNDKKKRRRVGID